jgi:hypothetical protein
VRAVTSKIMRCLLVSLLCATCAAQQSPSPGTQGSDNLAKAREKLSAVEAAHPGNSNGAPPGKAPIPGIGADSSPPAAGNRYPPLIPQFLKHKTPVSL